MFPEGGQTRKHCFQAKRFPKVDKPGNNVFLAMFPEGGQTRKQCFLAMFPEDEQIKKHCFLTMFPEDGQTRKHCFLAMFFEDGQKRNTVYCSIQAMSSKVKCCLLPFHPKHSITCIQQCHQRVSAWQWKNSFHRKS